jgi:hypothetical protein
MKLETKPEKGTGAAAIYILVGCLSSLALLLVVWGTISLFENFPVKSILLTILVILLCCAKLYFLGYVTTQLYTYYWPEKNDKPYCHSCGKAQYCFFWTEWWHKRTCLPRLVNKVGGYDD